MSKKKETKDLAVANQHEFAVMNPDINIADLVNDTFGGEEISVLDLEKITVPSGGGTTWEIPDADEEDGILSTKALEGVIIYHASTRTYWEDPDGNGPPDCFSPDAKIGIGMPGGECRNCPMAKFGSSPKGGGQACGMKRIMFILREGDIMPKVLNIPPTSLKAASKYLVSLLGKAKKPHHVLTRFTLVTATNPDNKKYSKVVITKAKNLPPDVAKAMDEYRANIENTLAESIKALAQGGGDYADDETKAAA